MVPSCPHNSLVVASAVASSVDVDVGQLTSATAAVLHTSVVVGADDCSWD
jgi:hypothetical protein